MRMKRFLTSALTVLAMVLGLGLAASPAHASPADGNYAQCIYGTTVADWTGKNPQDCTGAGTYALLQNWNVVLKIYPTTDSTAWNVMREGYSSAQSWCSSNSLTCGVLTSAGVSIAVILLGPANS
jgi:hypothetical protein